MAKKSVTVGTSDGRSARNFSHEGGPAIRRLTYETKKVDAERTKRCRRGNGMSHRSAELVSTLLDRVDKPDAAKLSSRAGAG